MTRLYLQGRTETVRPVTLLSSQFVRAMCDPSIKDTITVSLSSSSTCCVGTYHGSQKVNPSAGLLSQLTKCQSSGQSSAR